MILLQRYLVRLNMLCVFFLLCSVTAAERPLSYQTDIEPIFESKCLACHGCYDAPCQLKLEAPEGLDRGASKDKVYNGARTESVTPTRLFQDALTTAQWREKDFFSVIDSTDGMQSSLLYNMLALGRKHRFSDNEKLPWGCSESTPAPSPRSLPTTPTNIPWAACPWPLPGSPTRNSPRSANG